MEPESLEGKANSEAGRLERAAGDFLGDDRMKVQGEARSIAGQAEEALGAAKGALRKTTDRLSTASGQAADAYANVVNTAQDVSGTIESFVVRRPFLAIAGACVAGMIVGGLFLGGGPKVIYVKPSRA